jgi:hypothetical protein
MASLSPTRASMHVIVTSCESRCFNFISHQRHCQVQLMYMWFLKTRRACVCRESKCESIGIHQASCPYSVGIVINIVCGMRQPSQATLQTIARRGPGHTRFSNNNGHNVERHKPKYKSIMTARQTRARARGVRDLPHWNIFNRSGPHRSESINLGLHPPDSSFALRPAELRPE